MREKVHPESKSPLWFAAAFVAAVIIIRAATATQSATQPTTQPAAVVTPPNRLNLANSVFKQPSYNFPIWINRGVTLFYGWEEQNDANGKPTVHLIDYLNSAQSAGVKVLVQLDAVEAIPWNHPAIAGFVQPDEADDLIVNGDTTVYGRLALYYKTAKQQRPDLAVYLNIDGWQWGWHKVDYGAIFACADYVGDDYYYDARDLSMSDWVARQTAIKASAGGKMVFTFVATSFQNLDPTYYPGERTPTAASVNDQFAAAGSLGLSTPLFPQSFTPFRYDSTPADVSAAITLHNASAPPKPVPPPLNITVSMPGYVPQTVTLQPQ